MVNTKGVTKGEWKVNIGSVDLSVIHGDLTTICYLPHSVDEWEANANLIVAAVQACKSISDNPMAVAESIKAMHEMVGELKKILEDKGRYTTQEQVLYKTVCAVLAKMEGK